MTAAEFAFLAVGLVLGAASGAALVVVYRSRPPVRPEVRVTFAQDAVPRRRPATLATDPFAEDNLVGPARGGPADPPPEALEVAGMPPDPTRVRFGETARPVAIPVMARAVGEPVAPPPVAPPLAAESEADRAPVPVPVVSEADPMYEAIFRVSEPPIMAPAQMATREEEALAPVGAGVAARFDRQRAAGLAGREPAGSGGTAAGAWSGRGEAASEATGGGGTAPGGGRGPGGPDRPHQELTPSAVEWTLADDCADLVAEADQRCRLAESAREELVILTGQLVRAREARDAEMAAIAAAEAEADAHQVRSARDRARDGFQTARLAARTTLEIAAAASDWLAEIDRINAAASEAGGRLERQRAAADVATATMEHLIAEADAARRAASAAEAACQDARSTAKRCSEAVRRAEAERRREGEQEEKDAEHRRLDADRVAAGAAATGAAGAAATEPDVASTGAAGASTPLAPFGRTVASDDDADGAPTEAPAETQPGSQTVIGRILSGDLAALDSVVAQLADDPAARQQWESRLTDLLEAILLRAVDASAIAVPLEHPFWGNFTGEQARDIMAALSALGYRFDGLGGWLDDRQPGQRELSMAVAHAGLDPMRIRRWPTSEEVGELVREAEVLGLEYLASVAPSLSVPELRSILGHDGDVLADVWTEWDRIRPLLVAED